MEIAKILRYLVIGIIYIILFRIVRIMYLDLKGIKPSNNKGNNSLSYAMEVVDAPENIGIARGSLYPVHKVTNIGRKGDNHIVLNDPFVSSYHATIFFESEKMYIKDLNSTNGVLKNGSKIENSVELSFGDVIEIGRVLFKIVG